MSNKEKLIMHLVSFMCFGVGIVSDNLGIINKLLFTYKLDLISVIILCLIIGLVFFILYFAIVGTINSWIINLVYIISYLRLKYSFVAYNFYPFIYIKNNKQKLKFSINILCMFEIYSMVNLNNKISNKKELDKYIADTKVVFRNVKITHYILILLGIAIGIFNISLGIMMVSYNIGILLYQSVGGNENLYDGYIYLSKNLKEENVFHVINQLIKVQDCDKKIIYDYLQKLIINKKINNISVYQFYNYILLDSVDKNCNYLNEENRYEIENNMKREAYLNSQLFLKCYRLYRMYCIYVFKFYGREEYESIKKVFNVFYENESKDRLFNKFKMFKEDKKLLNTYRFNNIKLQEMFDICNIFDYYNNQLKINLSK